MIDNYVFRDSSLAISSFFPFLRCNLSRMNSGQHAWQPCLPTMLAKKQYTFSSKDSSFPMWRALYFRWIPMLNVEFRLLNFGFIFDRMRDEVKIFLTQQKKNYAFRSISFYRIERVRWHLHDNTAHASYNREGSWTNWATKFYFTLSKSVPFHLDNPIPWFVSKQLN